MRRLPLALALLVACSKVSSNLHVPSPTWEEQVVYFVMTDRFANGDPTNDDQKKGEFDPADINKYSGGDLQGIIDKLDYIQGLGATAVWITPPVANMWWDPLQQSGGYHGYWARNLKKVDEHLGTLDTYQKLSSALHKRGMYLIQDVVPNHMGNFFQYSSYDPGDVTKGYLPNTNAGPGGKPDQPPFDQNDPRDPAQRAKAIYHWTPAITDYNDPNQEANYQISDLDDLNTENPVVRTALKDSYGYWIKEVGVDAFRVDTVKFVPHDFWNDFFHAPDGILATAKATGRNNFFAFGEVYEIPPPLDDKLEHKVAGYLGTAASPELPALLAYPLYGEIGRVFAGGKPTSFMTYRLQKFMDPSLYPNPYAMPTFLDNHDVQRFLSVSTPNGLAQAIAFLFTVPGIPIVYYGTEQRFVETRQAMFAGGYKNPINRFDSAAPLYQKIKLLSDLRRASKIFTHGALEVAYDSDAGAGAFAYRRTLGTDSVLVLMNTAEENVLISGLDTKLAPGTGLDVLLAQQTTAAPKVGAGGLLTLVLPPRAVIIARANGQVTPPPAPPATITVTTKVDGQTFTGDTTISGTLTPATEKLWLVLDGYTGTPQVVTVNPDGTWSTTLQVSTFATGVESHALAFYAPDVQVSTPRMRFTSNVAFTGAYVDKSDPVGDDTGPKGTYTYPQDSTFAHQMDLTHAQFAVGATTLVITLTMRDFTTVWNPPLGFDHVAFNVFFSIPGRAGATALPYLNAPFPGGAQWSYDHFAYGWSSAMYGADGATASTFGTSVASPKVKADPATRTIAFTYDRRVLGLASWSGVKVYLTTWDFDGIKGVLRPLSPAGGQWEMGGGAATDPRIMDDLGPVTLP